MKTLILLVVLLFSTLNAVSILHVGIGLGAPGGVTVDPYESPTVFGGANAICEYEIFFQPMQSVSIHTRYSGYNKAGLLSSMEVDSRIYYFGVSYNISNLLTTDKFLNEISPIIAYGFEKVEWGDGYTSYWDGSDQSVKGEDFVEYVSVGLKGSLGIKKNDIVLKIILSLYYDSIIYAERDVMDNTGDWIGLEDPKYKTDIYGQIEFSLGFMF